MEACKVENGVVSVTLDKPGNGGILLTGKKHQNFEVYLQRDRRIW